MGSRNPFNCLLLLTCTSVTADLPVHCLHEQMVGEWTFHVGQAGELTQPSCGHDRPDHSARHLHESFDIREQYQLRVTLSDPAIAEDSWGNIGFWTMVYDEGFVVHIGGRKFFSFSKFVENGQGGYNSICSETLVGWHHNDNNTDWGCYTAIKLADVHSGALAATALQPHPLTETMSNAELEFELLQLDERWEPDKKHIDQINQRQSDWTATIHPQFKDLKVHQVSKMFGNHREQPHSVRALPDHRGSEERYGHLPASWDWRNVDGQSFDGPVANQGLCGSCYAIAALGMIEDRIRILTKNKLSVEFDIQQVLGCSYYNQGCDGGYPFLVGKFAEEMGLLPSQCSNEIEQCREKCDKNGIVFRVHDPHYTGGFYGGCNEAAMMEEIYSHGPIVASLEPDGLMSYSGGVFTGFMQSPAAQDLKKGRNGVHPWEKVDHSILVVGYGIEPSNGQKYWIAKNSWGPEWGEDGYFRIRRGTDELAFESMSMVSYPIIHQAHLLAPKDWWKSNNKEAQELEIVEKL